MKRILLSSAAIVAFAGAAAAEGHNGVSFTGSANLGYNDDAIGDNDGFYSDLDIVANLSQTLDNGLTVGASFNLDDLGSGSDSGFNYELSLTSDTAGLYFGDTAFAAESKWTGAGPMDNDDFSEADGEVALRGEASLGGFDVALSYAIAPKNDTDLDGLEVDQLSIGATGDFGSVNVALAYQEAADNADFAAQSDKFNGDSVFGISVGTSFAGADVRLAYAESEGDDSVGVSLSYPAGPVTIDAGYSMESAGDDNWELGATYEDGPISVTVKTDNEDAWKLEGSYDAGNGLVVYAGVVSGGDDFYVAGEYDLGSGASLLVSHADAAGDDVGANDYQVGTTVELSFSF